MIKFFTIIRHRLITENKFSKYLFYAIGEIVLVVIGILIAVQINNWNEDRKLKVKELKILNELHSDLIQNVNDIKSNIDGLNLSIRSNEIIKYHIENLLPYNDSLNYHFYNLGAYVAFTMNQTTYDNLKQIGMDLISDDSLRLSISELYGYEFVLYKTYEDQYLVDHYARNIEPIHISEFTYLDANSLVPKDYNQLKNHPQLIQVIYSSINLYTNFSYLQSRLLNITKSLIGEVEKEIEKLKQ